jgi:hypothetical protein
MQLSRAPFALGALAIATAVACSDSGTLQPDAPRTTLGTTGQSDTSKSPTPPTNPQPPRPDSVIQTPPKSSTDPRPVTGTVNVIGPASDTSKYERVAGATVVVSTPDDSVAHTAGKEVARAISAADGTFSLGTLKIGGYVLTVTAPAGSSFKGTHWGFAINEFSPTKVDLGVWLGR